MTLQTQNVIVRRLRAGALLASIGLVTSCLVASDGHDANPTMGVTKGEAGRGGGGLVTSGGSSTTGNSAGSRGMAEGW